MKKIRKYSLKGFTLIELLVVVIIMLLLMGLIMAVNPSSERATTLARLSRISSAVTTYHEHFQAYPRSYHYDMSTPVVTVTGDYTWPDPSSGSARTGTMYQVITTKGLRRRDLKYIDQMFVVEDETNEMDDGYLIDGWYNRFLYYSGSEIHESTSVDADYVIAKWLKAAGNYDAGTAPGVIEVSRGMHNPNDYFFLMSAGDDGMFYYEVLPTSASDRHDPAEYIAQSLSPNLLVPKIDDTSDVYSEAESFDDMTTYNIRK